MRQLHLSPAIVFKLLKSKPVNIKYAFSFDHKNLVHLALKFINNPKKIIDFAGLTFYSGFYNDQEIIVCNGGTYGADTAISTEISCYQGAKYLIRVGSCGSLTKSLKIGDILIPDDLLNELGITKCYEGKISISKKLNFSIERVIGEKNKNKGKVWSYDALFRESKELILEKQKKGAIGVDMALASFVKVANHYKRSASACFVASDNLISGEIGFRDIKFHQNMKYVVENIFNIVDLV